MTKVLNDNRKYVAMTEADGDALFAQIATATIEVEKISAAYDKKINTFQNECQEKTAPIKENLSKLSDELDAYIAAHPERFEKPRARQLPQGKYGIRAVSNLQISDENAVIEFSDSQGLYLYSKVPQINKDAVKAAIISGTKVDGAAIVEGERRFHTVKAALLEEARKQSFN